MGTIGEGSMGDLCVTAAVAGGATRVVADPVPWKDGVWGDG